MYQDTELEVRSEKNQLLLDGSGGAAVLAYKEPLRFQVYCQWCFMVGALPTFVKYLHVSFCRVLLW